MEIVIFSTGNFYIENDGVFFGGFRGNHLPIWADANHSKPFASFDEALAQMNLLENNHE